MLRLQWEQGFKAARFSSSDVSSNGTQASPAEETLSCQVAVFPSDRKSNQLTVPQASHTHDAIAEAAQLMKEAVDDIMVTLNEAASEVGLVGGMVESIAEAMGRVSSSVSLLQGYR